MSLDKKKKLASNVVPIGSRKDLMGKDLERSGITSADAQKMKCEELSAIETAYFTKRIKVPSYKLPYFTADGQQLDFFRLRLLDDGRGFGATQQRYWQKPNSLPLPYFPPGNKFKWRAIINDPKQPLVLTEGEKKAYVACKMGIPCIGLGGVWSWRSKKHEVSLLPELKAIKWEGREVYLAFDSDLERNTAVLYAARAFATTLLKQGAKVVQIKIPSGEMGENVGLDDYLLTHSAKKFWALPCESLSGDVMSQMELLNNELTYVEDQHTFYHLPTSKFVKASTLLQHTYANRTIISFDEKGSPKTMNIFDEWSKWTGRRSVKRLIYAPGQPTVLDDGSLNTWLGWGVKPKKGNVKPWKQLLDYIFINAKPEHRKWFEQWLAYPLQYPGTKLYSYVLLWSLQQRVGKSLIGLTMGRIYGAAFSQISSEDVRSAQNYWLVNKMFILAEEVTSSDKRSDADRVKHMITRETVSVNIKFQPQYDLSDFANYLFTSNHVDAMFFENDQRGFVHEIEGDPADPKFYGEYDVWFRSDEGAAALFDYLLHLDLKGFSPRGHAPVTDAKIDMTDISQSDLDAFVSMLREDGGQIKVDGQIVKRTIMTAGEIAAIYDADGQKHTSRVAMGKALRRGGFRKKFIKTTAGSMNVWILRATKTEKEPTRTEVLKMYEKERGISADGVVKKKF